MDNLARQIDVALPPPEAVSQADLPDLENDLETIVQFTNVEDLHIKLLYLQCVPAAAAAADYDDNVHILLPQLDHLGRSEDEPEEVKLEVAIQIAALGKILHDQQQADAEATSGHPDPIMQLQGLAASLLTCEDDRVVQAAQATVLDLAALLGPDALQQELLPALDDLMQSPEPETRSAITQLYAHLGHAFEAQLNQEVLLPRVLQQAEDLDFPVRREVALGLAELCPVLPADSDKSALLETYIKLCADRVWAIRKACADVLPDIGKVADMQLRVEQLIPVFDDFCEDVSTWVQISALQQLGPFIATLESSNVPQGLVQRMAAIPELAATAEDAAQLLLATAFNFPAVLATAGRQQWPLLQPVHTALMQSQDPLVRRTLACSLHEVASLLGPEQAMADLASGIQDLCCQKHLEVQEGFVHFFPDLLSQLPAPDQPGLFQLLLQHLSWETSSWRCRISLAHQLGKLAAMQALQEDVLSFALSLCRDDTATVRAASAAQMGHLVQTLWGSSQAEKEAISGHDSNAAASDQTGLPAQPEQQDSNAPLQLQGKMTESQRHIVHQLQAFSQDDSFQMRQQYIEMCYHLASVSDAFSATVFQTHFLPSLLQLLSDQVSNVRLALARVLGQLKHSAGNHFPQVTRALEELLLDTDQDVASQAMK